MSTISYEMVKTKMMKLRVITIITIHGDEAETLMTIVLGKVAWVVALLWFLPAPHVALLFATAAAPAADAKYDDDDDDDDDDGGGDDDKTKRMKMMRMNQKMIGMRMRRRIMLIVAMVTMTMTVPSCWKKQQREEKSVGRL